jgi:hypothetical protein
MHNSFFSHVLFHDLEIRKINACRTVWLNSKNMPPNFKRKKEWHKSKDVSRAGEGGESRWLCRERKKYVYMLSNTDQAPVEGNFCDDNKHVLKLHNTESYNNLISYVTQSSWMANSYSISQCTSKWITTFFFHLLDLMYFIIFRWSSTFSQRIQTSLGVKFDKTGTKTLQLQSPNFQDGRKT